MMRILSTFNNPAALRVLGRAEAALAERTTFCALVALAAVLVYGYEVFSFRVGIDEELYLGLQMDSSPVWIAQGRWGVALLNHLLLFDAVVPAVSTLIGILGLATGLVLGFGRVLPPAGLVCAVLMGLTFPAVAFLLDFKSIAFAAGVGFVCVGLFARLADSQSRMDFILASLLGALAIGIYQTFAIAMAGFGAVTLYARLGTHRDARGWWLLAARLTGALVLSCVMYAAIDLVVRAETGQALAYVGNRIDLKGFIAHFAARMTLAWAHTRMILGTAPILYGMRSHVTTLALEVSAGVLVLRTLGLPSIGARALGLLVIAGSVALLVTADAVPPDAAAVWTWGSYLPVFLAAAAGFAAASSSPWIRSAVVVLTVLSVIGNAAIVNRLAAASTAAYQRDFAAAEDIGRRIAEQSPGTGSGQHPLQVMMIGYETWTETPLIMNRANFGASFLAWDMGNWKRLTAFLRLVTGLPLHAADPITIKAHAAAAESMPSWPEAGSVRVIDDVAMIKFSAFSPQQRVYLCAYGLKPYCKP